MDDQEAFGRSLRRLRRERDLTQETLAQQAYCAMDTIKKIEAGRRRPSRQLAAQLADCLGLEGEERAAFLAAARAGAGEDDRVTTGEAPSGEPLALPSAPRHNLPHQATAFIGRAAELAALDTLLAEPSTRQVTIIGPGGMGKTRLALAATERLLDCGCFPDGVFFVALAPLGAPDHIVPALAEAIDFPLDTSAQPTRTPRQQVLDYLRAKRLLLLFDNFEHLLSGAELVADILHTAPAVTVLVTSRERLDVRGEHLFPLTGMATEADADAVALFAATARQLRPDFALDPATTPEVAHICALVEGMPLAIELAAGWVDTLTLADIIAEIQSGLDVLETTARDMPARHRSVRAACDTTWQLLGATERAVFAQLAVFRGGGTRRAIQAISGATLRQLNLLIGKSLLSHHPQRDRYTVHGLLRQYATERLAADPAQEQAVRDRHAAYYCAMLATCAAELKGARQVEALAEIEADVENARAAWEWATRHGRVDLLTQALDSLGQFYLWLGRYEEGLEALRLASTALEPYPGAPARRALSKLLAWRSVFTGVLGQVAEAELLLARSLALLDSPVLADENVGAERAFALLQQGHLIQARANQTARTVYGLSLELFRELGDRWGAASALTGLGAAAQTVGDFAAVEQHWLESLTISRELGDPLGTARALEALSQNARFQGRIVESERLAQESYAIYMAIGNRAAIARGCLNLGRALSWSGDNRGAEALLTEAAAIFADLGDRRGMVEARSQRGVAGCVLGHYRDAQADCFAALALARELSLSREVGFCVSTLAMIALGERRYADAQRFAREAIAIFEGSGQSDWLGRVYGVAALADWGAGQVRQARRHIVAALRIGLELSAYLPTRHALWAAALLFADSGDDGRAVELGALNQHMTGDGVWYQDVCYRRLSQAAAALPPDVAAAAQARGRELDFWQTASRLLEEVSGLGWDAPG